MCATRSISPCIIPLDYFGQKHVIKFVKLVMLCVQISPSFSLLLVMLCGQIRL
jgi:hypothetical protein